jgi:microcystin-dependent protein
MAQPYVGEIRIFAGNFAPAGWMFCEGQLLPISENETLFQLIGTTYGGDGESTFALPDLRGRLPMHQGNSYIVGQSSGAEEVTLTTQQLPVHTHGFLGTANNVSTTSPQDAIPATQPIFGVRGYGTDAPKSTIHPSTLGPAGGNQPHTNFQPYLCVDFIISMFGIFPSPT